MYHFGLGNIATEKFIMERLLFSLRVLLTSAPSAQVKRQKNEEHNTVCSKFNSLLLKSIHVLIFLDIFKTLAYFPTLNNA